MTKAKRQEWKKMLQPYIESVAIQVNHEWLTESVKHGLAIIHEPYWPLFESEAARDLCMRFLDSRIENCPDYYWRSRSLHWTGKHNWHGSLIKRGCTPNNVAFAELMSWVKPLHLRQPRQELVDCYIELRELERKRWCEALAGQ